MRVRISYSIHVKHNNYSEGHKKAHSLNDREILKGIRENKSPPSADWHTQQTKWINKIKLNYINISHRWGKDPFNITTLPHLMWLKKWQTLHGTPTLPYHVHAQEPFFLVTIIHHLGPHSLVTHTHPVLVGPHLGTPHPWWLAQDHSMSVLHLIHLYVGTLWW